MKKLDTQLFFNKTAQLCVERNVNKQSHSLKNWVCKSLLQG